MDGKPKKHLGKIGVSYAPYDDTLKYNVKFDGTGELTATINLIMEV